MIALWILLGVAFYVVAGIGWLLCDFTATDAQLVDGAPLLLLVAIWPVLAFAALRHGLARARAHVIERRARR